MIKTLPLEERPREKLLQNKAESLTTAELVAIIIGSGTKNKSVLQLSREIVSSFGTLQSLAQATIEELCQIKGIGLAKAIQLKAAFALGVKLSHQLIPPRYKIDHPEEAYQLVRALLENKSQEHFLVILLDVKNFLIRHEIVTVGTLTESLVHPRDVFNLAIRHKAASIIAVHNHPSGDPAPSKQDKHVTEELRKGGELLGIPLCDHIIVGRGCYFSFREMNL
jgi:DNA repair protein RadC